MANFLLTYHGEGGMPSTDEERAAVMGAWNAWFSQLGDAVVDGGNPTSQARAISPDGSVMDATSAPDRLLDHQGGQHRRGRGARQGLPGPGRRPGGRGVGDVRGDVTRTRPIARPRARSVDRALLHPGFAGTYPRIGDACPIPWPTACTSSEVCQGDQGESASGEPLRDRAPDAARNAVGQIVRGIRAGGDPGRRRHPSRHGRGPGGAPRRPRSDPGPRDLAGCGPPPGRTVRSGRRASPRGLSPWGRRQARPSSRARATAVTRFRAPSLAMTLCTCHFAVPLDT